MKTFTIRDFRTRPRAVREALSKESKALLTVNGRPLAVLLPVNAETYDQTLDVVSRAEALQLLNQIRQRAKSTGRDKISAEEIDAEIDAVRREARQRDRKAGRG
ncbi:MAG: type II toxin-antitoxin system Phd/YefM family antitoxin [Alphaproteobacteria bacterium]|nr:type II toxin-antitoxin system Phd/YefM family antitoxin [Alphaproteobacteria bacterium]MBV8409082.1 type II toxin-antitoxin system Phd/YefM family antitoxin [Alphaproteobacteria bacterium]